jgi:hypothetical protein
VFVLDVHTDRQLRASLVRAGVAKVVAVNRNVVVLRRAD